MQVAANAVLPIQFAFLHFLLLICTAAACSMYTGHTSHLYALNLVVTNLNSVDKTVIATFLTLEIQQIV